MPRTATMSIAGLYNYDDSIFDGFRVPESIEDRRQDIIDEICLEAAELTLLYTDPNVMKFAITKWTNLNFQIWQELQATREYVYNPIWNKDGTYTETETRDFAGTRRGQSSSQKTGAVIDEETETATGTEDGSGTSTDNTETSKKRGEETSATRNVENDTTTTGSLNQTITKSVQGFNSTDWADAEKEVTSNNTSGNENQITVDTSSGELSGTETGTEDKTGTTTSTLDTEESRTKNRSNEYGEQMTGTDSEATTDTGIIERTRIEQGNIGVTTTQQMILEQREVVQFSTERFIIDSFIDRFCLLVY